MWLVLIFFITCFLEYSIHSKFFALLTLAAVPTPEGMSWVAQTAGAYPEGALIGGNDTGNDLYVARAVHEGAVVPGKLFPAHNVTYIAWGRTEHAKQREIRSNVLVAPSASVSWVANSGGTIPEKAILGGISEGGEVLYIIGRASHKGTVTVGKVNPSHGVLYFSYGGTEVSIAKYEIVVLNLNKGQRSCHNLASTAQHCNYLQRTLNIYKIQ